MSFASFIAPIENRGRPDSGSKIENHLEPTHAFIDDAFVVVTAWQYSRKAPVPVWVARKFHRLSDDSALTAISADGSLVACLESDWIIAFKSFPGFACVVLSPDEFTRCFTAL